MRKSLIAGVGTDPILFHSAGAGGGVVASRLAQAGKKVLLMDAGLDYESANTTVPAFHARSNEDPNIDWAFEIDQGLPG